MMLNFKSLNQVVVIRAGFEPITNICSVKHPITTISIDLLFNYDYSYCITKTETLFHLLAVPEFFLASLSPFHSFDNLFLLYLHSVLLSPD